MEVSFHSYLTSVLDGVSGYLQAPRIQPPIPIEQESGWAGKPVRKLSRKDSLVPLLGIETRIIGRSILSL
jgi:hypothetical protein